MVFKGIAAGFLMAAMVWLIPGADTAQFHVITLMTYLIAVGGFMHIVAGSVKAFLLALNGALSACGPCSPISSSRCSSATLSVAPPYSR
jgi:formate/nitrite transporter FocA (FNT family)